LPDRHRLRALSLVAALVVAGVDAGSNDLSLIEAVRSGNRPAVTTLLRGKADVNLPEPDGTTALHWAAQANDVETARLLLKAGANAKVANRYGATPLSVAAINGNPTLVQLLLEAGADPNGIIADGQTVLMVAARTGNADVVRQLLDRGANVAAQEALLGENALMWAASENHGAVVALLLARGANPNARSKPLNFPKDRFGLEGVLTILPKGGWTPLMYAARDGAPDAARALIEGGAEIDAADAEGTTALIRAIQNAHYDTAVVLIERGADVDLADTVGMGPLYAAVDMSSLGEVFGRPPRRVRDRHTVLDLITRLLERGADPNAVLKASTLQRAHTPGDPALGAGATPLMRAAKHGDHKAVALLLEAGADVSLAARGGTALMYASGLGRGQSAFAEDVGAEPDFLETVKLLLARGAEVNAANPQGGTPAHFAAQAGFDTVIQLLAQHGAALDVPDKQGRAPADLARGVGVRGRAGGPPIIHADTAALIERLLVQQGKPVPPPATEQPAPGRRGGPPPAGPPASPATAPVQP
jgi:ankyrin repeat protein